MRYTWTLAAAAVTVMLAGCGSLSDLTNTAVTEAQTCPHPGGMILIIGAHRDAPAPQLDPLLDCELTAVIRTGGPARIMIPDSPPQLITPQLEPVNGGTLAQQASPRVQHDVQLTEQAIANARPDAPGVDDLNALAVAADEARTLGGTGIEIVLIDSGLDDRGTLNFTVPGLLAATPAEVADQLRGTGNLPELRQLTVVIVGLGYTAPPQTPLSPSWRASGYGHMADSGRAPLEGIDAVDKLALAAIDREVDTAVGDYDIDLALRLVTLKLVGCTEVVHALRSPMPPSSSSAAWPCCARTPARPRCRR